MTRRSLCCVVAFAFAATAVGSVISAAEQAAPANINVSGEWVFDVQTDQGSGSPTFVFTQTGEKLTGKYKGTFGEADLTGTVSAKTIKFSFNADAQGMPMTIAYDGEIESESSIKGKVDLGGMATGTFTGKRTK